MSIQYIDSERGVGVSAKSTGFGKLLRDIRIENNESPIIMAGKMGITVSRLDAIEKRIKGAEATPREIENIVRGYGLPKDAYDRIAEIVAHDKVAGNGLVSIYSSLKNAAYTNSPKP